MEQKQEVLNEINSSIAICLWVDFISIELTLYNILLIVDKLNEFFWPLDHAWLLVHSIGP